MRELAPIIVDDQTGHSEDGKPQPRRVGGVVSGSSGRCYTASSFKDCFGSWVLFPPFPTLSPPWPVASTLRCATRLNEQGAVYLPQNAKVSPILVDNQTGHSEDGKPQPRRVGGVVSGSSGRCYTASSFKDCFGSWVLFPPCPPWPVASTLRCATRLNEKGAVYLPQNAKVSPILFDNQTGHSEDGKPQPRRVGGGRWCWIGSQCKSTSLLATHGKVQHHCVLTSCDCAPSSCLESGEAV